MLEQLLIQAQNGLQNMKFGQEFELRDLFKGTQWNAIKKGDRINLGKLFKKYVESSLQIRYLGKTSSNHCIYKK